MNTDDIRARHNNGPYGDYSWCAYCGEWEDGVWPCDAARAADEIDRLKDLVKDIATHADTEARRAIRAEATVARVRELCADRPETAECSRFARRILRTLEGDQ